MQLEDLTADPPLLPGDAKLRAHSRLWTDYVSIHIYDNVFVLTIVGQSSYRPKLLPRPSRTEPAEAD